MTKQRMNNDLISREALKEHKFPAPLIGDYQQGWNDAIDAIIDNAPAIEYTFEEAFQKTVCEQRLYCPARPQGEWIKEDDEHLKGWYRCSECGRRVEDLTDDVVIHAGCEDYTIADIYPYCHCGADMRGGGTNE